MYSFTLVVLGMDTTYSICLSAAIALFYTVIGGLYSVAYTGRVIDYTMINHSHLWTDVLQLVCIFIGLCVSIPFAAYHEAVEVPIFQMSGQFWVNNSFTSCMDFVKGRTWLGSWSDLRFVLF